VLPTSIDNGRKTASLSPSSYQILGKLKTSGQLYWYPDKYTQAFISVIQTFQLTWKDIMLLLDQTLFLIRKAKVVQATQVITIYNEPQY
jgi:hypothetical protein